MTEIISIDTTPEQFLVDLFVENRSYKITYKKTLLDLMEKYSFDHELFKQLLFATIDTLPDGESEDYRAFMEKNVFHEPIKQHTNLPPLSTLKVFDYNLDIPYSIIQFVHLKKLELQGRSVPLSNFSQLEKLIIGDKNITTIPTDIKTLTSLKKLSIFWCHLTTLPAELGQLPQLKRLYVGSLPYLRTLPASLRRLKNLTSLYINNVPKLTTLPADIENLQKLSVLTLEELPELTTLPPEIGNLSALEEFTIKNLPKLRTLPDTVCNLPNLKHLKLEKLRRFQTLPNEFGKLEKLEYLHIRDLPRLRALPDSIGQLKRLEKMYLFHVEEINDLEGNYIPGGGNVMEFPCGFVKLYGTLNELWTNHPRLVHFVTEDRRFEDPPPIDWRDRGGNLVEAFAAILRYCKEKNPNYEDLRDWDRRITTVFNRQLETYTSLYDPV